MEPKFILLAALIVANFPLCRLLFRFLFRGNAPAAGAPGGESSAAPASPKDFLDPAFRQDVGRKNKLFLLLVASALLVFIEYSLMLGLFPALHAGAFPGAAP